MFVFLKILFVLFYIERGEGTERVRGKEISV